MKAKYIILLMALLGCTEPVETNETSDDKYNVVMPEGNILQCDKPPVPTSTDVRLTGCTQRLIGLKLSGDIKCSHGVCWED